MLLKKEHAPTTAKIDKLIYNKLFQNLFPHSCSVRFWDGEEIKYGDGDSNIKILLNEPLPLSDIIFRPSITFGEAYMNKQLDIEGSIQDVIESLFSNPKSFLRDKGIYNKILNPIKNTIKKSKDNINYHYDIGNDFYQLWLDKTMTYSCGYFKSESDTLEQAQINKVDYILRKLNL
ncbi:MAG: cfa [Herbinix sp.]|jgi:cyclopropane-fatty-acyl-phospholipid synthase|nr:cfa [Herbinix sp.]